MNFQTTLLTLGAGLALGLSSCVVPAGVAVAPVRVGIGWGVYDTLPPAYADPYYVYGGRYYYGGRWETGRYYYGGHYHSGRYYHNGHYIYGGRYNGGHHHRH